jgi:hypothetical protein
MKSESLQHDHAMALAAALLEIVENCIRPEERRDAFDAFYTAAKAGIESYELHADRMRRRVQPSAN